MTLTEDMENDLFIADILSKSKTIAMVGASQNWKRPSNFVMKYLQKHGYKVIPVNPRNAGENILGELCYSSLKDIPIKVDMVNIFRGSEYCPSITKEAIKIGVNTIWMQLGIKSEEAKKIVEENKIEYVEDRCTKMEYQKHFLKVRQAFPVLQN